MFTLHMQQSFLFYTITDSSQHALDLSVEECLESPIWIKAYFYLFLQQTNVLWFISKVLPSVYQLKTLDKSNVIKTLLIMLHNICVLEWRI